MRTVANRLLRFGLHSGVVLFLSAAFLVSALDIGTQDLAARTSHRSRSGRNTRQRVCPGLAHPVPHCQASAAQQQFVGLQAQSGSTFPPSLTAGYELVLIATDPARRPVVLPECTRQRPPPALTRNSNC